MTSLDILELDIATRMVGEHENIYVVQPGRSFWAYDTFRDETCVFLDLPGLELPFDVGPPDRDAFREIILRSIAIDEWLVDGKTGAEPSRLLSDYDGLAFGRRLGRYVGAAQTLYFDLKPGTIVVVPGQTPSDQVLIGEIVGKPSMMQWESVFEGEKVAVRKVKWHGSKLRASFSEDMRARLGTPNPILQLERSLRGEVLKAGFPQFAFEGQYAARLSTKHDDFNSLDDYNIQLFVNYIAGLLAASDLGMKGEIGIADAISILQSNPEYAPQLALNINSKGFQRYLDDNVRPLVIAAFLTLALATPTGVAAAAPAEVSVVNSGASGGDKCSLEVKERIEAAASMMLIPDWQAVCKGAKLAEASTGLSTTMRVKPLKQKRLKPK